MSYVIFSLTETYSWWDEEEEHTPQFWNIDNGWIRLEDATRFTDKMADVRDLPSDGQTDWVWVELPSTLTPSSPRCHQCGVRDAVLNRCERCEYLYCYDCYHEHNCKVREP